MNDLNHSKEILEIWVKTQTKQMENFTEALQNIQEIFGKEGFVELFIATYNKWFEKQKSIVEEMNEELKKYADVSMPNFLLDLNKSQEMMNGKWATSMKQVSEQYFKTNVAGNQNVSIEQMNELWNKFYQEWLDPFTRPFKEFSTSPVGGYNVMMEAVKDYMKAFSGGKF
jgi:hypothetical protein